jgi:NTE family protein
MRPAYPNASRDNARMPKADLVLEGGGVKGLGLVGAVLELMEAGYTFARVAGTSAGAVVASLIAAGASGDDLEAIMQRLDYERVPDGENVFSEGYALLSRSGIHPGRYIHAFVAEELARLGVRTFADLKITDDPDKDPALPAYRLVVCATDLTTGTLLRLPWDYPLLGLDPDEQLVADAVHASLAIPLFFEPVILAGHTLVDGGVLSNFPIEIFDRTDGQPSRWPTFGIRLLPDLPAGLGDLVPVLGLPTLPTVRLLQQVVATALVGRDQTHLERPGVRDRTMAVDTRGTEITEFRIRDSEREALFESGQRAARDFLRRWGRDHPDLPV